jgi:hypothetical protein
MWTNRHLIIGTSYLKERTTEEFDSNLHENSATGETGEVITDITSTAHKKKKQWSQIALRRE